MGSEDDFGETATEHLMDARMDAHEYTPRGAAERWNAHAFRRQVDPYQSAGSRRELLDSMYKELLDTSVRADPYLRKQGDVAGCHPARAPPRVV